MPLPKCWLKERWPRKRCLRERGGDPYNHSHHRLHRRHSSIRCTRPGPTGRRPRGKPRHLPSFRGLRPRTGSGVQADKRRPAGDTKGSGPGRSTARELAEAFGRLRRASHREELRRMPAGVPGRRRRDLLADSLLRSAGGGGSRDSRHRSRTATDPQPHLTLSERDHAGSAGVGRRS